MRPWPAQVPGTTVLAAAPLIGLAELYRQLVVKHEPGDTSRGAEIHLAESEILHLGQHLMQDLASILKED
jgi:hypothetical protein